MESFNESLANTTMTVDVHLVDLCDSADSTNSSACDKSGLGISLSTPIIMLSVGVLGNCLALVVLYTARKEVRKTVFYTLLAGLAWTDLIGQLLVGPVAVIVYANDMKWVGGDSMCTYHAFMMIGFGAITPLIVCCLSLERFLALRFTYFYARQVTRRKAKMVFVALWGLVIFFCTFPLMGFGSYERQFPGSWCFLNFHKETPSDVGYASVFSVINILVITVIIICNTTVAITLLRMRRKRRTKHSPSIDRHQGVKHPKSKTLKIETETQMVWFLCGITVVFSACWLPLNVHILINQITAQNDIKRDLITVRLASINQILDPWLYILLRKSLIVKIIKHVKSLITFRKKKKSPIRSRNPSSKVNTDNKVTTNIALALHECEVNVICEKIDEHSTASSNSIGSNSSTNKLIPRPPLPKRGALQRSLSAEPRLRDFDDFTESHNNDTNPDVFIEQVSYNYCVNDPPVVMGQFPSPRKSNDLSPLHVKLKRLCSMPIGMERQTKRRHHSQT